MCCSVTNTNKDWALSEIFRYVSAKYDDKGEILPNIEYHGEENFK